MATVVHGIVNRIKGRQETGPEVSIQHFSEIVTGAVGGADNPLYPSGHSIIKATTAAAYFTLGPPIVGTLKTITVTTMSSGITIRTNSTGAGGVFFDSTSFTMIHPSTSITSIQTFSFIAASSVLWCSLTPVSSLGGSAPGTSS